MEIRIGGLVLLALLAGCKNDKQVQKEENSFQYQVFSDKFKTVSVPYFLTDTGLLNNKDTVQIRDKSFSNLVPDSIKGKLFGKNARIKYMPLAKIAVPDAETYYIVKAVAGSKKNSDSFLF